MLLQLCSLSSSLGALGPSMRVCLTFGFFRMLRQSNLAPPCQAQFDPSRHTCRRDIIQAPPGLLIIIRLTKTHQTAGSAPVLPIPAVPGHPVDPVAAYHQLLASSPSSSPDHPLFTYTQGTGVVTVMVCMLAAALATMLQSLGTDYTLFSFHSLHRGSATTAYHQGMPQDQIK